MRQRITIEVEGMEESIKEMTANIETAAFENIREHQARGRVTGYSFHEETLPEKASTGIQIPDFLNGRRQVHNG